MDLGDTRPPPEKWHEIGLTRSTPGVYEYPQQTEGYFSKKIIKKFYKKNIIQAHFETS